MDSKSEHIREVYAHFGLAIYAAQCLEHGLVNALIYLDLLPSQTTIPKSEVWTEMVDSFTAKHFEHTLGKMITDLKEVTVVSLNLNDHLSKALRKRNWLAHDYFRERAEDFLSTAGREKMINELLVAIELFKEADNELSLTLEPVLKKYGITEETLKRAYEEMFPEKRDAPKN